MVCRAEAHLTLAVGKGREDPQGSVAEGTIPGKLGSGCRLQHIDGPRQPVLAADNRSAQVKRPNQLTPDRVFQVDVRSRICSLPPVSSTEHNTADCLKKIEPLALWYSYNCVGKSWPRFCSPPPLHLF